MKKGKKKIVVTGDICINTLHWVSYPHNTEGYNWQHHERMKSISRPGESLHLAKLTALSTGLPVLCPEISESELASRKFLRSTAELELFPVSLNNKKDKVYRVKRFLGFSSTASGEPELLPVINDDENAAFIIIDDENNGFNNAQEFWPAAIKNTEKKPVVLYKMNNPIGASKLWQHLDKHYIDRTIVVINADDMRLKGVNISRSLSWERTAMDFIWQLSNNPNMSFLANCRHLIVPFGLEGVIYYSNTGTTETRLYFLPNEFEGEIANERIGKMYGLTSCFVAGLAKSIADSEEDFSMSISDGIKRGMAAAKRYYSTGFGTDPVKIPFPDRLIFEQDDKGGRTTDQVQDVKISNITNRESQNRWYILKEKSTANLAQIAYETVKYGESKSLKYIPTARFGQLKTVDRTEIESYRSIKNLFSEYVAARKASRPISIAVFGTPGSGKSYGVTEVAASIAPGQITKLSFNLSQLRSPAQLSKAFHKMRDITLEGKIPLVILDEFDSYFEGRLGWLKYFLGPMQDGLFREEESVHPIGKAIFVFAGGTSSSFEEFCGELIEDESERREFTTNFKMAKGPDFVSRLRGYVNMLGPNPTNDDDQLFIIRRAMLLRSLIERKIPHLINNDGEAQIDTGVLRALLKVPKYKHEARSMEAIMEMSMLTTAKKWGQSVLPSEEQLKLHVDEEQFLRYMMHDAFFGEKIDALAANLHEKLFSNTSWHELQENKKDFYREQVRNIPDALMQIQYDVIFVDKKPERVIFTEDELKELAQHEYKRIFNQRMDQGREAGETENQELKTDTEIQDWIFGETERKMQVYRMVNLWAVILADSNFKLERLKVDNQSDYE